MYINQAVLTIALAKKGINKTELASMAGCSYSAITNVADERDPVGPDIVARIAKVLDLSPDELTGDNFNRNPDGGKALGKYRDCLFLVTTRSGLVDCVALSQMDCKNGKCKFYKSASEYKLTENGYVERRV